MPTTKDNSINEKKVLFGLIKREKQNNKRKVTLFGLIKITYHKKLIKKKKICIIGNCVTAAIPQFLVLNKDFNKKYEILSSKPIFMVQPEDIDLLKQQVSECDIFITQPVGGEHYKNLGIDTESLKKVMKKDAKIIIMPVPYFTGYFPCQCYLHDSTGTLIGEFKEIPQHPSPYHNKIIFNGYLNNLSEKEILDKLYSDNALPAGLPTNTVKSSIDELKRREAYTDFGIADFIEKNYKKHKLFYTLNHPTNYLLNYMCEIILKKLGIKKHLFKKRMIPALDHEPMDFIITPILPCIEKELGLQKEVMKNNLKYSPEYINACYKYYRENPDIVEINKEDVAIK